MRSAIGFAAVFDCCDADAVAVVMKADAVVADPQPELRRFDVPEALNVSLARVQVAGQRAENTESGGLIDGAELRLGLIVLDNVLAHAQRSALWGSSGVRPMRSKSSRVRPNSANTCS